MFSNERKFFNIILYSILLPYWKLNKFFDSIFYITFNRVHPFSYHLSLACLFIFLKLISQIKADVC